MNVGAKLLLIRDQIFAGRQTEARAGILALARGHLTAEQRLQLAFLANRAFLFSRAASLLHRVVRPKSRGGRQARDEEKAEYARALGELGAANEGIEILRGVDARKLPRVNRILAHAYFRIWKWESAVEPLKLTLASSEITARERAVAKISLGTALLHGHGDLKGAERSLNEALTELQGEGYQRARWEALQMLTQVHYMRKDWARALRCLDELAGLYPKQPDSLTGLLERKWRVLIAIERAGVSASLHRELDAVRDGLTRLQNWFHLRDLDYYVALSKNDTRRMVHLYYGTPFASAKTRILRDFGAQESALPKTYELFLGPASRSGETRELFDTLDGSDESGRVRLKPGHALQRLIVVLLSDFYCPPNVVQLHEALYPAEHFNPASSPVRVRQVLKRLRGWFKSRRLALVIEEKGDRYSLQATRPMRLRLRRDSGLADAALISLIARARLEFKRREFKAAELQALAGGSRPTAVALLNRAVAAGELVRTGRGPRTRYRLARDA